MTEERNHVEQNNMTLREVDDILMRYLPADELQKVRKALKQATSQLRGVENSEYWRLRDPMTGLYNQEGLTQILEQWRREHNADGEWILLLCMDVDKLANIVRVYGQTEGDIAVRTIARMMEDCFHDGICGRLERGEFAVVMRAADEGLNNVEILFHTLEKSLETYNRVSSKEYSLHVIHSMCAIPVSGDMDVRKILDGASLRTHKKEERNIPDGEWEEDPEEHRLVRELLDKNLFRYAFQPIVDAKNGDIYAYEALMRPQDGTHLSPLTILRYASQDGRLYEIEKASFFNVLGIVKEEDLADRRIFINSIPGYQLKTADYKKLKDTYGSLFSKMVVEVTEQTEMTEKSEKELLKRAKEDGFDIAIDDYGTGYSNTASLLRFLPNCVKIDHLLITGIQENPKKQHFVNNIITFAHENGMLALAEGVETSAELKAVIQMGIDLIQGFYTAKPDYKMLDKLDKAMKEEIIADNISMHDHTQRKIYIVNNEKELSLMRLALEQYTGIVISQSELTLIGNPDYTAGMSIKIKDGCTCKLTLRNTCVESIEDMPCLELGSDVRLTLVLEGTNTFEKVGIRVPDGSSCRFQGTGDLIIHAKGIHGYGIGNDFSSGVGTLIFESSGRLAVQTDGNQCIGIGGGIYRQGEGIRILAGKIELGITGVEAVGIGSVEGDMPIEICNCSLSVDFRVATGNAVGNWRGSQKISISDTLLEVNGSGSRLCGVGSVEETDGEIRIRQATANIRMNGQRIWLLGNTGGGLSLSAEACNMKLVGEGNSLLGVGSYDKSARIGFRDVSLEIDLRAADPLAVGAKEEDCKFKGGDRKIWINEDH